MDSIDNKLFLRGKVKAPPFMTPCKNGGMLAKVTLGVPRANARDETVDNIQFQAWNGQAEWCRDNLKPGDEIFVEARLCQSQWEDKKTGEPRSAMVINASDVCRTQCTRDGESHNA